MYRWKFYIRQKLIWMKEGIVGFWLQIYSKISKINVLNKLQIPDPVFHYLIFGLNV